MDSLHPNSVEDIFDSSLNLEDSHFNEGFKEGYNDGLASGKDEGKQVGLKQGFEIGEELGFYRGCIDVWNSAIQLDSACFSSRVQKTIKQMDELVRKYPISDPENESATDIIDSLRLKFRAICATLNLKLEYNGYPKASNVNEVAGIQNPNFIFPSLFINRDGKIKIPFWTGKNIAFARVQDGYGESKWIATLPGGDGIMDEFSNVRYLFLKAWVLNKFMVPCQ